jgi:hypothetical protein
VPDLTVVRVTIVRGYTLTNVTPHEMGLVVKEIQMRCLGKVLAALFWLEAKFRSR